MAPRPKAAAPRKAKPKARARARPGPASRWPARALWLSAVLLAFATPAAALAQAPDGLEKRVVTSAASLALVGGLGVAAACHWLSARRSRVVASWAWLTVALCLTLAVAASGRWAWMTWAAGAACLAAGLGVFAWLERRDPAPFRPDRRGLLHGALGLPAAYLPVAALWGWRLSMG